MVFFVHVPARGLESRSILRGLLVSAATIFGLSGCAGSSKVYAPADMPEICQDIDFNRAGADLKAECGVQTRNYMAYRNIPEHRNLLLPKGAKIVRKGKNLDLRLEGTLPIELPESFRGRIGFGEKLRRTFIKNKMDYCEFFPRGSEERLRLLRLDIPMEDGGRESVCYSVGGPPTTAQRKAGYAGKLENLNCSDFEKLKALAIEQNGAPGSEPPEGGSEGSGMSGEGGVGGKKEGGP